MAEPKDMIVPLLREMRERMEERFDSSDRRLQGMEKRLGKIEESMVGFRQALTADTLMSKLITGEFEERIEALEQKVRKLEKQK